MEFVGRNFFAIQKAQFLFTYCGKSRVQILTRARCQDSGYKPTFTLTPLRWSLSPNDATIKVLTVLWVISGLLSFFSKYRAFHDACGYIQMFFGIFCEVPNFFSSFRSLQSSFFFVMSVFINLPPVRTKANNGVWRTNFPCGILLIHYLWNENDNFGYFG